MNSSGPAPTKNAVGPSGPGNVYPAQHGSRYGLGLPGRGGAGTDSKMNGLHGPKHKRGDIDRECKLYMYVKIHVLNQAHEVNRFAGTRLEDLQGEIPALCKDQHGCRYLQKKLEEGVPEHRDMIFRETFGHFADLMTGQSASFSSPSEIFLRALQILSGTISAKNS